VLPVSEKFGLGTLPYFPLAHGFLTGKYRRDAMVPPNTRLALTPYAQKRRLSEKNFDILDRLELFVQNSGRSMVELAFAWLLGRASVGSVIAGASTPQQVQQNARASGWELTVGEMGQLDGILSI